MNSKRKIEALIRQKTVMADLLILYFVAPDAYERHRGVFLDWLCSHGDGQDEMSLWLQANNAVEQMALNWDEQVPASTGVSVILWKKKQGEVEQH